MEIVTKYVLDACTIEEPWKTINVRSRSERWVVDGTNELRVDGVVGFHRISLDPGDWSGADRWGVRAYADVAWTPEVVDAWSSRPQIGRPGSLGPVGA